MSQALNKLAVENQMDGIQLLMNIPRETAVGGGMLPYHFVTLLICMLAMFSIAN